MDITDILMFEEGYRKKPYYCSEGYPTIGIGTKIGPKNASLVYYQFEVNEESAKALLQQELDEIIASICKFPWFQESNQDRRIILMSMAYQMGVNGLLSFRNTLKYITNKEYTKAAENMLVSKWAQQTPQRAKRHAQVMAGKTLKEVYGAYIHEPAK